MRAARDVIAAAMPREPGLLGVHFEGPFWHRKNAACTIRN